MITETPIDPKHYLRLSLAITHPDFDDIWLQGHQAGRHGLTQALNPFKKNSRLYEFWNEGWWVGFYHDDPWFKRIDCGGIHCEGITSLTLEHAPNYSVNDKYYDQNSTTSRQRIILKTTFGIVASVAVYGWLDWAA